MLKSIGCPVFMKYLQKTELGGNALCFEGNIDFYGKS